MLRTRSIALVPVLACALALSACTLNVSSFARDVSSESDAAPFTSLRADLAAVGSRVAGTDVVVRGADRTTASAVVTIAGLLGADGTPDDVARGVQITWPTGGDPVRELRVRYDGPALETVWLERAAIELPLGTGLDLTTDDASVDVAGLDAMIAVTTGSGSIRVRDAAEVLLQTGSGSIDVVGDHGRLSTSSGSISMTLAGAVQATSSSGSFSGTFGGGGELVTASGSVSVTLTSELDRDLLIATGSGSIHLVVPPTIAARIEAMTENGSVSIHAGGVDHGGSGFDGDVGGGGPFTIQLHTSSGSIAVTETSGT